MANNIYTTTIPAISGGMISCLSYACFEQNLTISGLPQGDIIFTGTGEGGVKMKDQHGNTIVHLEGIDDSSTLTFTFEYDARKGNGFQPAVNVGKPVINKAKGFETITVASEDVQVSPENPDTNDTTVNILYIL